MGTVGDATNTYTYSYTVYLYTASFSVSEQVRFAEYVSMSRQPRRKSFSPRREETSESRRDYLSVYLFAYVCISICICICIYDRKNNNNIVVLRERKRICCYYYLLVKQPVSPYTNIFVIYFYFTHFHVIYFIQIHLCLLYFLLQIKMFYLTLIPDIRSGP